MDWGSTGKMVGAGPHQCYSTGMVEPFSQEKLLKRSRRKGNTHDQSSGIQQMRKAFDSGFGGFEQTEYDAMIGELKGHNRIHPACDFTEGFSSGEHVDTGDTWRSYTRYARRFPSKGTPDLWFLYPHIGLAIEVDNGICISWDGRFAAHCTAVPHGLTGGDELYAAFFSLSAGVEASYRRQAEMRRALDAYCEDGRPEIESGTQVWVRWYPIPDEDPKLWRRATGRLKVIQKGIIEVAWPSKGSFTKFTAEEAKKDIVPAWHGIKV